MHLRKWITEGNRRVLGSGEGGGTMTMTGDLALSTTARWGRGHPGSLKRSPRRIRNGLLPVDDGSVVRTDEDWDAANGDPVGKLSTRQSKAVRATKRPGSSVSHHCV